MNTMFLSLFYLFFFRLDLHSQCPWCERIHKVWFVSCINYLILSYVIILRCLNLTDLIESNHSHLISILFGIHSNVGIFEFEFVFTSIF